MILDVRAVSKSFRKAEGDVRALEKVSVPVEAGEFLTVSGPSGSGKTTLLLIAGGLLAPDDGAVVCDEENLYDMSANARARFRATRIGFVFQQYHLIPFLNVVDNILAPTLAATRPAARKRARELAERFGLGHRIHHLPGELSSGEKQRVAFGRALMNGPRLLLADEPTGNLDDENSNVVLGQMRSFAEEGGSVLMASHDVRAADVADRRIVLSQGRLAEGRE